MKTTFRLPFFLLAIALTLVTSAEEPQAATQGIWVIDIDGAIGPATSDYVLRGIADAEKADAKLVVLRMNTPGGLDNAMRDIIEAILSSDVPVVSYVGPKGARAASAGTYISYASHVAAMAPATNLGAATPVQMGAPTLPSPDQDGSPTQTDQATAMEKKMVNDASAYIRGLAELRDRNADWAEAAVREAASLDAESALAENVIDIIATDIPDLRTQLEGLVIDLDGKEVTLNLEGVDLYYYEADLRTEILSILTNPSMILVLGMIGIYGIILEFYNPGALVPGVIGAICLLLAAYSVQLLPLNYAGLALIILGVALMVAEAMIPSFGILGIGGIIAFSIGGLMLFDTEIDAFQVGLPTIAATATISALLLVFTVRIAIRVHKKRIKTGLNSLIGESGQALEDFAREGQVRVGAEIWRAVSEAPVEKGDDISVTSVDGLVLHVEKKEGENDV